MITEDTEDIESMRSEVFYGEKAILVVWEEFDRQRGVRLFFDPFCLSWYWDSFMQTHMDGSYFNYRRPE